MNVKATKIGGVDPAVIRELSGIYKPFVKAFKELVSNAYDADADLVKINLADDLTSIEIIDYGRGITPLEFRSDFTKVGGSYTRLRGELTPKGRPKIGSKGIGFLAVARYCSKMEISSTTDRLYQAKIECQPKGSKIDLILHLGIPIPRELLSRRLIIKAITVIHVNDSKKLPKRDYEVGTDGIIRLLNYSGRGASDKVKIDYSIDCRGLEFSATIDFDYLLSLENKRDLEEIEDFCTMQVYSLSQDNIKISQPYTKIKICNLKEFVRRELSSPRKIGYVRNIESQSGIDQFLWNLQRCIPVKYDLPLSIHQRFGQDNLESSYIKFIEHIVFSGPSHNEVPLKRPVWGTELSSHYLIDGDISAEINIDSNELMVRGYILGAPEIIYPAEYRGLAVRVRNVQIGAPHFFGVENLATGAAKAALSQITGEINVLKGMDAIDALNPGRESFYEENAHFKLLKRHLVGENEAVGGLLSKVIKGILTRSQVMSAANDQIARADQRRKALLSLSMAINHYSTIDGTGTGLRKVFNETTLAANGLLQLPNYDINLTKKLVGFRVENRQELEGNSETDFTNHKVYFDFNHDRWSWQIFMLGKTYDVIPKLGNEKNPLCQLDTSDRKIYINWGHPIRQQMGDTAFIKSAIAWKVAFHACHNRIEDMMDLALKILAFDE